jgi:hypothetical protein
MQILSKSQVSKEIHFVCIDNRYKDKDGKMMIALENNQNIVLPPQVTKVPALLLLNQGHRVLFGKEISDHFQPREDDNNMMATSSNGEPLAFSLGSDNIGGFGVMSDSYSFWDQGHEELSAKGQGGLRQMYNYASINFDGSIETPPDTYTPDKVGTDVTLEKLQQERNTDIRNS